jgi:hypothetical protein
VAEGIFIFLLPLALHGNCIHLDVEHDEAPQLVELEVHPELFRIREFLLRIHGLLLIRE